ncbi:hypothetical protein FGG08_000655 [Glutinoglossum americanum]|uniref:NAD(P)-binding domain-containing protein n=1 Tax=Glutinoglossum americanum TaxID=1670608 RepID=A0A9P8L3I5_9PEZI|nr:hypothetical protein FGG08_000655 [Glutinoglossum americanum]
MARYASVLYSLFLRYFESSIGGWGGRLAYIFFQVERGAGAVARCYSLSYDILTHLFQFFFCSNINSSSNKSKHRKDRYDVRWASRQHRACGEKIPSSISKHPIVALAHKQAQANIKKGSNILKTLLSLPEFTSIVTISRRAPPETSSKLHPIVSPDNTTWTQSLTSHTPPPQIFFSGLATTRAAAGSLDAQREIDFDLNHDLAHAARAAGAQTYVLISALGANSTSSIAYSRMKGELDDAVSEIGFEKVVLVRPGFIVGEREESRMADAVLGGLARMSGFLGLRDMWAQDAEVIARAAVKAGMMAKEGKAPEGKVWVLGPKDIVRLGRDEWGKEEGK